MEAAGFAGVVQVRTVKGDSCANAAVLNRTREEILDCTGSRYAPAATCAGLVRVRGCTGSYLFIGKPCDVIGARKLAARVSSPSGDPVILVSIFCAGTPSQEGTRALLQQAGISNDDALSIRYRGNGWPGDFTVTRPGETDPCFTTTYEKAWSFLQRFRPYKCHLCPDGTGEQADISVGDAWHRPREADESGVSLIVARTAKGLDLLMGAIEAGYLSLDDSSVQALDLSQKGLMDKKCRVGGRLFAFRMMGIPAGRYRGYSLFYNWLTLPLREKARSVFGTWRRILSRRYFLPRPSSSVLCSRRPS